MKRFKIGKKIALHCVGQTIHSDGIFLFCSVYIKPTYIYYIYIYIFARKASAVWLSCFSMTILAAAIDGINSYKTAQSW